MDLLASPDVDTSANRPALWAAVIVSFLADLAAGAVDLTAFLHRLDMEFWLLALLAVIAELRPFARAVAADAYTKINISVCFSFAIMALWGVVPAVIVQALALVAGRLRDRSTGGRMVLIIGRFSAALLSADVVLALFGLVPSASAVRVNRTDVLAMIAAAAAWSLVNFGLLALSVRRESQRPWRQIVTRALGYEVLAGGGLLLLAAIMVTDPNEWMILLVAVPLVAVNALANLASEREKQLRHDSLTGLLSRGALHNEVNELIMTSDRTRADARFALLLLDLDGFKNVNTALGHEIGDRLLAAVAQQSRLSESGHENGPGGV